MPKKKSQRVVVQTDSNTIQQLFGLIMRAEIQPEPERKRVPGRAKGPQRRMASIAGEGYLTTAQVAKLLGTTRCRLLTSVVLGRFPHPDKTSGQYLLWRWASVKDLVLEKQG